MTDSKDNHSSVSDSEEQVPDVGAGGDSGDVVKSSTSVAATEKEKSSPTKNGVENGSGDAKVQKGHKEKVEEQEEEEEEEEEEEKEDTEEKPKEEGTNKRASHGLFEGPVIVEGKRDRKKTSRLSDAIHKETIEKEEKGVFKVPEGSGDKFEKIPYIAHVLQHSMKNDDLNLLHRLCFTVVGARTVRKKNIKQFCGFDFEEGSKQYESKLDFLTRVYQNDMKKYILLPLGLKSGKNKEETAKIVLEYCMKPTNQNVPVPETGKKKKKKPLTKKSKKKSDETKVKKPKKKKENAEGTEDEDTAESDGDDDDSDNDAVVSISDDESNKEDDDADDSPSKKEKASSPSKRSADDDDEAEPPKKKVKKKTETEKTKKKTTKKPSTPKSTQKKEGKTEPKKKTPKKKPESQSKSPKKTPTKSPKKKQKAEVELSSLSSDSDSDDAPLVKKTKKSEAPTDDEVKDVVKRILDSSDLEDLSIRKVFQQVSSMYPEFDLSDRQKFIKKTVKEELMFPIFRRYFKF